MLNEKRDIDTRKIVFFCQAGADVVHILKEIDSINENDGSASIRIICLTTVLFDCFNYIELPSNVKFEYFRRIIPPIKKPWRKNKWIKIVDTCLRRYVLKGHVDKVYFTSVNSDPTSCYYIGICLKTGCDVSYLNHYDDIQAIIPLEKLTFKESVKLRMIRYMTGLHFSIYRMGGRWNVLHFHYEDYPIQVLHPILNKETCKKYAYKVKMGDKKAVLVYSQPNRDHDLISDEEHDALFHELVARLKNKGYYVVLKGHPRLGVCPINVNQADEIIPKNLSAELIDLTVFDACYGFITIALSSSAKLGASSYSILPLMKDTKSKNYKDCVKFTNESSEGKIKFVTSWGDL